MIAMTRRQIGSVWLIAGSLLVLSTGASPSGTFAQEIFAPKHVAKTRFVTSAAISPDGNLVAYTLSVPRQPLVDADGSAWTELHVVDAQGQSRPFSSGHVNVSQVQWTPNGDRIAFVARRGDDKKNSLYVIPVNGGEARRVVSHASGLRSVSFSPDGKQVAFLATDPGSSKDSEYKEKGFNQEIYEEELRHSKVWITSADGSGSPRSFSLPGSAHYVEWNPKSRQLVVVLAPTPLVDDYYMSRRVFVVDADSGKIVERIRNPGKLGQVSWSPDGKRLAMISGVHIHDPSDGHLMIVDVPSDGGLTDLMPTYEAHVNSFAWKDATTILWVADEGVATTIGTSQVDGTRHVLHGPDLPVLSHLSLSTDGSKAALVGHRPEHPREVHMWDGETIRRLTNNNPWLENIRLAKQEPIHWKAKDGLQLEGILMYPLNYEPGRRYPVIMVVHGGPEAHVSNGWITRYSYAGQVGAARGLAIFYPNYRGSTGRGVKFSMMGQADAAGKEFDDLVDGVDHLIEQGIAHKDKIGITGGSYGGYASAWGATYYSDRFAASVMFVGISDNVSKVGTTDIPEEMFLVHHRKRLWEDWEYFLQRSPIRHVQKHRTPILILHGKDDPRVHPSQSLELHRHLKTLKQAPARLVLYPGEGHGNRRAAARLDYNLRMLRWMEHYLQGEGGSPPNPKIDYAESMK